MRPLYSAVFLDDESHNKLVDMFSSIIPRHWDVRCEHHMSVSFGLALSDDLREFLGHQIVFRAVKFGQSDLAMALEVDGFPSSNPIPHITLATNIQDGGEPKDSNRIKDWVGIDEIELTGYLKEIFIIE